MSNKKISVEDKIYAVKLYLNGIESKYGIVAIFNVNKSSVLQWISNYESMDADAFKSKRNKKIFRGVETAGSSRLSDRSWLSK